MKRMLISLLALLLLAGVMLVPVNANSAQSKWEGVDQSGAIIANGDSPIVVEREVLTFDLQQFPQSYYREVEEFLAYTGKVTAEYTFYNPSDMTVTATLLFPFGCEAQYGIFYDESTRLDNVDGEKYDVLINGAPIEKKLRHTLSYHGSQFDLEKDLGLLSDTFVQDDFYSPDLAVTKYTFRISGVDTEEYRAADVAFDVPQGMGSYRIYFPDQQGAHTQGNKEMRIGTSVRENGHEFDLYVFGTPFGTMPEWKVYENGGVEDKEEIAGSVEHVDTATMTFKEFALSNWREDSGVSEVDWYNATVAEISDGRNHYDRYPIAEAGRHASDFRGSLMRWYEYEIVLQAGERVVNAVTAPIYPAINLQYEPDVFTYTYLLSPAHTWASFGALEIVINTPFFVTESSLEGFEKTETGYVLVRDGLPDGELVFTLSESENPVKPVKKVTDFVPIELIISFSLIGCGALLLIAGGIGITIVIVRSKRKKK